jgi:toxin secretion/phage lysis holin
MHKTHFDIEMVKHTFTRIVDMLPLKAIAAIFGVIGSWIFNGETQILVSVYVLILLDTTTGAAYAAKTKTISSRGIYRTAVKCLVYFVMLTVGRIVDKHAPIQFAAPIMDSFLVMTEALSILENLAKLGFPVPTKLMQKLHVYWDKDYKGKK